MALGPEESMPLTCAGLVHLQNHEPVVAGCAGELSGLLLLLHPPLSDSSSVSFSPQLRRTGLGAVRVVFVICGQNT